MADSKNSRELNQLLKQQEELQTRLNEQVKAAAVLSGREAQEMENKIASTKILLGLTEEEAKKRQKALEQNEKRQARINKLKEKETTHQKELNDLYDDFSTSFAKMTPQIQKALKTGEGHLSNFDAITGLILEHKINEVNLSEEQKKLNDTQIATLTGIREELVDSNKEYITQRNSLFGIHDLEEERIEALMKINSLSGEDKEIAKAAYEQTLKRKEATERLKEIQEETNDIAGDLPESLTSAAHAAQKVMGALIAGSPILLLFAAIGFAVEDFLELDKAAGKFREDTGYTKNQTYEIEHSAHEIALDYAKMGVDAAIVYEVTNQLKNEFSDIAQFSDSTVAALSIMTTNLGISEGEAAKLQGVFEQVSGLSQETAANVGLQVASMAEMAGVSPKEVLQDISKSAGITSKYFHGDVGLLKEQVIKAHQLGQELEDVEKVAKSLLNFEENIADELVAATFVGGQFNLSQARGLAAAGKMVQAQDEVLNQIQRSGEFSKQDVFTQEALAKASNMTVEEINKQLSIRKRLGNLTTEEKEKATAAINAGLDITELNDEQLKQKTEEFALNTQIQSSQEQMGNGLKAIGTQIGSLLLKPMQMLASVFEFIAQNSFVLYSLMGALGVGAYFYYQSVKKAALVKAEEAMWQSAILKAQYQQLGLSETQAGLNTAAVGAEVSKTAAKEAGVVAGGIELTQSGPKIAAAATEAGIKEQSAIASIFAGNAWMGPLGLLAIGGILGYLASSLSKAGDVMSPADGKTVVSTKEGGLFELSANDDLVAAPGAAAALSGGTGGGGVQMNLAALSAPLNSMINEIKALRADLNAGKISVYMDGSKVTSGITKQVDKTSRNSFNLA
jgi:hypothetical protein